MQGTEYTLSVGTHCSICSY